MNSHRILLPILLVFLAVDFAQAQRVVPLEHRWEVDPGFGDVWNTVREPRAKFLNIDDLKSDQAIVRFEAAQNICLNFDRPGFRNSPKAMALLLEQLGNQENTILAKRTMISAACLLDDGANAQAIWNAAQSDPLACAIVETHLTKWKSTVALEIWRQRLKDPKSPSAQIENALNGLAVVGQEQDRSLCLEWLESNRSSPITRFTAAKTLGVLQPSGLTDMANQFLKSEYTDKYLLAASLVATHTDPDSLKTLETILQQGTEVSQRLAASSIAKNFPQQGLAMVVGWTKHPDDAIRLAALELLKNTPSQENTRLQGALLADPDLKVRKTARTQLLELAAKDFRTVVDDCVSQNLASQAWQGVEQAIVLAVELQDRSRCPKFIELLEHTRPEVNMNAGWALMELANEPAILAGLVPHAERLTDNLAAEKKADKQDIIRLSFLFEAFGRNRYEPVLPMLRKYIPKDNFKMGNLSRASAIWAIGKTMKQQDDPALRVQLHERVQDLGTLTPENYLVGYACLLTLGEFGYLDSKPIVERYAQDSQDALNCAGRWAKEQIEKSAK
jgi:HEAT repeat protein